MKKFLVFAFSLVVLLGFSSAVFAATISLPNPLCLNGGGGAPNSNCDNGAWQGSYASREACYTAYGSTPPSTCINNFPELIAQITTYITTIIGALAVLMFVWAGILFVTSAGNEAQLTKAKHVVLYAVIGVAISLAGAGLVEVVKGVIGANPP